MIWNHYNNFHLYMREVEVKQNPGALAQEEPFHFAENHEHESTLKDHYQESVCWLFQAIQNLMANQQLETQRVYLFYIKILFDYYLKNSIATPTFIPINQQETLNFILQVFLQKIKANSYMLNEFPLNSPMAMADAFIDYPSFQTSENPFKMLSQISNGLDSSKKQVIAQLMTLALTTKQFSHMNADFLLFGCFESLKEQKGWTLNLNEHCLLTLGELSYSKSLYKNLLLQIQEM